MGAHLFEQPSTHRVHQRIDLRHARELMTLSALIRWFDRRVVGWATSFPALFFVFVLAGEIFVDHENRERLARRHEPHPLTARILQVHVTEEARHVCFVERSPQRHSPLLSWPRRQPLRAAMPRIMRNPRT